MEYGFRCVFPEHDVQFREAENEPCPLVDERDLRQSADFVGQARSQLEPTEACTEDQNFHAVTAAKAHRFVDRSF